jgi:hypothetical protein
VATASAARAARAYLDSNQHHATQPCCRRQPTTTLATSHPNCVLDYLERPCDRVTGALGLAPVGEVEPGGVVLVERHVGTLGRQRQDGLQPPPISV